MQIIKLTEELRLKLLDLYMAGNIDLLGYETKLIATAVHVSRRDCMHHALVQRLIRAKTIQVLEGVSL